MHIPNDEEITRFFENLSPEDFLATPVATANEIEPELYPRHGEDEFDRFVIHHLHRLAENEEPFAALNTGTENRVYFIADAEENLAEFLLRLSQEVNQHGAKWFFIGVPGEAAVGAGTFDPNDLEDVERARAEGRLMDVVNWYAESTEEGSKTVTYGTIFHNENDEQVIVRSSTTGGANPAFKRVMHP